MLRAPVSQASLVLLATIAVASSLRAQDTQSAGRVHDLALPVGHLPILASTAQQGTASRSQLLVDFIRRTYSHPLSAGRGESASGLSVPAGWTDHANGSASPATAKLPLPLPASVWIEAVFAGRETPQTLLSAITSSRGAALFYYGLLSLDEETRAWLVTQPELIAELAGPRAAAFVVAAPGLRVRGTSIALPGGSAAAEGWESLVGRPASDPAGFVRALVTRDQGRLAFFFGTLAQLTPAQLRLVLALDSQDVAVRGDAAQRLHDAFERILRDWRVDDSVFWRPAVDPALLATSLRRDPAGLPRVPGTRAFWTTVFADTKRPAVKSNERRVGDPTSADRVDFAWLVEQVFTGDRAADRRRYELVLLVSRLEGRNVHWTGPDAVATARAALTHPALIFSLERARLDDLAAFAAAARHAQKIAAIDDVHRGHRALAQFQGALALVARAGARGSVRPEALAAAVSSLSATELSERGDYDGRIVRWLSLWLEAELRHSPGPALGVAAAGAMERDALVVLAGPTDASPRFVDWEGTRYRIDFASAEGVRIARLLGEHARPFLSSARALVTMADAIRSGPPTATDAGQHSGTLADMAVAVGWDPADGWDGTDCLRTYGQVRTALKRAAEGARLKNPSALAAGVLSLADDLLARGLKELAYAVALGQPDRTVISPDQAARRHRFAHLGAERRSLAWELPWPGNLPSSGWHVTGSLLGLDLRLAEYALVRVSSRPPLRKPTLASDHRRVLTEAVVLADPASLSDRDRSDILSAVRKGRTRVTAARTPEDGAVIADEIRLSPARRTLLSWAIAADRDALPTFLSLSEQLWLGLEQGPIENRLHAWGAPAGPRTGCLCLELLDRQPFESLTGRQNSGALASGFPDLNLRIAELLDELRMPAALLVPVLAAATLDLVESAAARGDDDRQALLDFVVALRRERIEEYLALLTVDGPLVAVEAGGTR